MAAPHFINKQIKSGVWQADLTGAGKEQPDLHVTHMGEPLPDVTCTHDAIHDAWHVSVPIPAALIADGVQTFVISDASGATLDSFTLIAGDPLADDLRAEIALLRGELAVLKKAFRKHCSET